MSIWMNTMAKIDTAARTARGDFNGTKRALACFCTESLIEAAQSALAGMTVAERAKFAPVATDSTWVRWTADLALSVICGWVSCVQLREWAASYEASRAGARAELPAALEQLGAAL